MLNSFQVGLDREVGGRVVSTYIFALEILHHRYEHFFLTQIFCIKIDIFRFLNENFLSYFPLDTLYQ